MTPDQARAARALLSLSTRDVAEAIGFSAMMISKVERGVIKSNAALCWKALLQYYWDQGLAFYAGGVIRACNPVVATYADPLRERLLEKECGSAYAMAFDKLVELAARGKE